MKLLLDSDIVSALCKPYEKGNYSQAIQLVNSFSENPEICISIITFYEIQYGINADSYTERVSRIKNFVLSAKNNFTTIGYPLNAGQIGGLQHS